MRRVINQVINGEDLSIEESRETMEAIMSGEATEAQIASFITALRMKGETIEEITGAALVMREKSSKIETNQEVLVDVCGTGGDKLNTFNISTTTAFVVAAAGVAVAKHGNRSVSSKSGSADLLEKLGVNLNLSPAQVGSCIDEIGIGFMYAPVFHQAMKYAIGPRKEIGARTIFNLLGPLTNPAQAEVQLLGVYSPELTEPIAYVLKNLGVKSAFVVHGMLGLDELSTVGETKISQLKDEEVKTYNLHPTDLGLEETTIEELAGGNPEENAKITLDILKGKVDKKRDIVILNAAAALVAADKAEGLAEGIELAAKIIDEGLALKKLEELVDVTNRLAKEVS
ncbi:anthranilate phosphoribosyltransferase [Orenia metallireducens]|uniref:Anthranilate phosphoribosyltransferase n=1 Tax=Orenia metallireducens TaxID=1413210 RepID=A0A285HAD8_9FIRM|nr:anthranilate phosphoribosyltransferase [Orenia metallireducens]PRX28936.1 anthranilate phosphoribosyltransferase [Orenia metallireducens]SNY32627.1 anthranilate phosphoribosyltransferase [Orenia metallireducens]